MLTKRFTILFGLIFLFLGRPSSAQDQESLIDRVLAIVDSRPIFYSDIRKKVEVGPAVIVSEFPASSTASNFDKALNDAINFELILSASKDLDIEVSDLDLDQEINRYLEEQKITKDKLIELLASEGETFDGYRQDFRDQLTLRRFQRKVIAPSIKVTEKDIETYYLTQSGSASSDSVELQLEQIVININTSQSPELQQARKSLVQDLAAKLKNGMNFTEAAGLYSDDPNARKGSPQIVLKLKDLAPTIRGIVEPLKAGDFAGPIEIGSSFMFFKLLDRKVTIDKGFEAKRQELEQQLKILELRNQTNQWLAEQRLRATIKLIAEQ
jgi:peptidyl-prolyl cis-trans isomerase SurA